MTIIDLLEQLDEKNITLSVRGDELVVQGKRQALTPALVARLRENKAALLELIKTSEYVGPKDSIVDVPPNLIPPGCQAITPEMLPLVQLSQAEIDKVVAAVPGGAANVQDIYPLAPLQEGILFHHLINTVGDAYLLPILLAFETRERLDGFVSALQAVIARHDILRTAVVWEGLPEPVQVVWREAQLEVEEVRLDPSGGEAVAQLRERYDSRRLRLDVRRAPMVRCIAACDEAGERWLLYWLSHHLAIDHTTLEIMVQEAQAHLLGDIERLPEPLPFRNFVAQARLGISQAEHEAFFREMLGDVEEPTAPFGLLDARGDGSGVEEARVELEAGLARRLRGQARALGVSAASLCHLAWAMVLARVSGRDDVVFGTVLFGRMQGGEGADRVLGLFINTLPVRIRVGDEAVAQGARRVHELLTGLMRHEHASLALAQRCSRVVAPVPLFSSLLNYRHSPQETEQSPEASLAWAGIEIIDARERTNYPLALSVDDLGDGFALTAQVVASIDPDRVCDFMKQALGQLVEALEAAPETTVSAIDVLPLAERHRLLVEWNATDADYPREMCVHQLFEAQVELCPDAIALEHHRRRLTYAELNEQANRLARHLRGLGVEPGARIVVLLQRSIELVVAQLAILKCGAAYVPIDPAFPAERQAFIAGDCAAQAVITTQGATLPEGILAPRIDIDDLGEGDGGAGNLELEADGGMTAYVMYTSGSTGKPKGVLVPHRAIGRLVLNCGYADFNSRDRVAFAANPAFDAATMEVWAPLLNGGRVVIIDREAFLNPESFARALDGHGVTALFLTTAVFNQYAQAIPGALARLRLLLSGGERSEPSSFARLLGEAGPQHLIHCYGPTETTTFAVTHEVKEVAAGAVSIPLGRPIGNTQVYILDAHLKPAPIGVTGEIYIGGVGVAPSYLNRPELSEERFLADPFRPGPGARLYKTGDLGRWLPEGVIEFQGRNDFQVKMRGFRIELGEVEANLNSHPGVREAVVIAREGEGGDKRLVAYYTGEEIGAEGLRKHLLAGLPEYMVPTAYVHLEALPLNANGKVERRALPAPEGGAYARRSYEPPAGEAERRLAEIWAEVLKLDRVGRNDNFFELGGHSLLAITVIERMRREGLAADVRTLFTAPTLRALAEAIEGGSQSQVEVPPNLIPAGCQAIRPEMLPLVELTQQEIDRIVAGVPGGAANIQDIYPLAPLQEGILFHHLMSTQRDAYLLHCLLAFDTRERLDGFVGALQAVMARHDILRTAVVWEELPEPVQVVWREAPLMVEEVTLDPSDGEAAQQMRERFDPQYTRLDVRQAPMMRCIITHDATNGRWLLLWLNHHLVIDHTTLEIMTQEAQTHLLGEVDRLPEPLPFRNFVAQARLGISQAEHEAFFREMLGDVEEPTAPFGLLDARGDGSGIEEARIELEAGLARRLREQARAMGVSAASLCHLAWARVLARVSGRDDVVFGTVLFGRMQGGEGADRALGLFINTLPVRIRIGGEGVEQGVRRVHELLSELMRHEHASLALAQRCSGVVAPTPLFSSFLNYRHSPQEAEPSPESALAWGGIEVLDSRERTNYPLGLAVDDLGDGFAVTAKAISAINPRRMCEFMRKSLKQLVESLETAPETVVRDIDVMPGTEQRLVLREWNATETDYPREKCIHELFEEQVEKNPDAIALTSGERNLTYAELNARANRLAHHLRALGVGPDTRVAICVERSFEMVMALLATLKAGGAYVPLDPAYPPERLAYLLEDSTPAVLLTHDAARATLSQQLPAIPILNLDHDEAQWANQSETNPDYPIGGIGARRLAYLIYTSGSTGKPKGVMVQHQSLVNYTRDICRQLGLGERGDEGGLHFATVSTITADLGNTCIYPSLASGGCLHILGYEVATDGIRFEEYLRFHPIDVLKIVPSHLVALLDSHPEGVKMLPRRYLILGGEALSYELVRRIRTRGEGCQVINHYGPTETTIGSLTSRVSEDEEKWRGAAKVPIGRPIANTEIYVLDQELAPAPVGVTGEIYIGGEGVTRGYLNRPALTAERFLPDSFSQRPGGRIYKTGDLGRWLPDGKVEFLGRNDFQVKIRGFRIELGEIEAKLVSYPGVREAIVIACESAGGDKRLVAYYTGAEVGAEALRNHLSSGLPEYMVPSAYMRLKALPLTPNGKLDRRALPAPEGDAYVTRDYEPPQGETETRLAEIWANVLRHERVSRHDNFFELGGHSLLAITVIERMRREGLRTDVRTLFTAPTLRALAEAIEGGKQTQVEVPPNLIPQGCHAITPEMLPLVKLTQEEIDRIVEGVPGGPANVQDIYPLAPLQEGILFHHLMNTEGDAYLQPILIALETRERLENFISALRAVMARHDILRTAIVWEGLPEPVQVVWREAPLAVEEITLDPLDGDVVRQLQGRCSPRRIRLDVRQAPLMRCVIAHDPVNERWLLMCLSHHLVIDHTTLEIMVQEAQAHLLGDIERLPEPLPFRNFVAQARLGISQAEHEAFFREMLGDVEEPTAPFGLLDARGDGSGIEEVRVELEAGLSRRLREEARAMGVSAASLCHLAWAMVLARVSGRDDVVFGTVLFGRMQGGEGADRVLGLFINTLPVRIRVSDDGVAQGARQVHELLAGVMRHEHASLALAQRCSGVAAPAPLFSSLLNYRHSPRETEQSPEALRAWDGIEEIDSQERTNYPLVLSVDDLGDGFALTAQVVASIDPDRVCDFMKQALGQLVEALEAAPETTVSAIDVLPPAERHRLLVEWNATDADYPREMCVHQLFEAQVELCPDAIALEHHLRRLTYAELNEQANRLARHLRGLGVEPGARVVVLLQRSIELVVAQLAILKCGAAYVPIDPAFPAERQAFIAGDCAAQAVITTQGATLPEGILAPRIDIDDLGEGDGGAGNLELEADGGMTAYVMYTSGSTGKPKGVLVPHRAIGRLVLNCGYADFNACDRVAFAANPAFDAATMEVWAPLLNGGRVVIIDREAFLNPESFARALDGHGVTALFLTTAVFNQYAQAIPGALARLRLLLSGGERSEPSSFARLLGEAGPQHLIHCYGPTETTTFALTHEVKEVAAGAVSIPLGRPIGNTQVYILDAHLKPAPIGVTGEIYIGGVGVAPSYLNRPELSEERFLADPFRPGPGARLYKTGDLGRWLPEGVIEFQGRNDFQVKMRGFRIELGEVEANLNSHPGVREAVVIAREGEGGDKRLVAYYTGEEIGAEGLRKHLLAGLPEYMVPTAYVHLEALPLNANGKVDRRALPAPEGQAFLTRGYELPVGDAETRLARIWAEVLKLDRVGRHDNFFELGGHSLLAITVIERMRREGLAADVRTLFTAPTLRALAEAIEGGSQSQVEVPPNLIPAGCRAITPEMLPLVKLTQEEVDRIVEGVPGGAANVQDIYPLAPLQEGILFHHLMNAEGDTYLLPILLAFEARERLDAFIGALQAVIARHDILRTAVVWEDLPEPVQVVWREAQLEVEEDRLDPSDGEAERQMRERFDPKRIRIDVRRAPLMRCVVAHDRVNGRWLLMCLSHHLAIDHTTVEIMVEEAQRHLLGDIDRLPEPLPFRNFVGQARLGISQAEHEAFFREMLGDVEEPTAPFGLLDAQGDGSDTEEARVELETMLSRRLRGQARAMGVSAASLCHLAWAMVLARVSGRDDVVFGTVLFGRMQGGEGADRALGLFINTLPVRIRIDDEGVAQGVRQVHELLARLMRHEHASLALAQRCSGVAAPMPLFSSLLNYRHSPQEAELSTESALAWEGIEALESRERTNYPLGLAVEDLGEGFALTAQAIAPINPGRVCEFMRKALYKLVAALETAPETALRDIDVLPAAERHQVLVELNATGMSYPKEKCVHELFEAQVERTRDSIALTYDDQSLTYSGLNRRANRLAHYLRELGVRPDAKVAICMERSIEMVVALLATLKAGGGYVPLDPTYPSERMTYMLEDSAPMVLLTHDAVGETIGGLAPAIPTLNLDQDAMQWAGQSERNPDQCGIGTRARRLAYVIYTSGSTGLPKGVMVEHEGLVNIIRWHHATFHLAPGEHSSCVAGLGFDASACEIWPTLCAGATLLLPSAATARDPELLVNWWRAQPLEVSALPTPIAEFAFARGIGNQNLRTLLIGGDRLQRPASPSMTFSLINNYGPTETTIIATSGQLSPADELLHIGRPINNTQIYILDSNSGPAPIGVAGEIYIGGAGMARGYLNRPELTAERFLPDPFGPEPGARVYKTGDLGRWLPDGRIAFLGRNDFQVKIRGFRIELGEIETTLTGYPGVCQAVVLAREDAEAGKRLVAYYTGEEITAKDLHDHLSSGLPEYMVPLAYVHLKALPLTPNGKLDRQALPAPEGQTYVTRGYQAPVGEIEERMAQIWAGVLKLERVGRYDNFFELGGHSLLAISLINKHRQLGVAISVTDLFTHPTIESLATYIQSRKDTSPMRPVAIPLRTEGTEPPLFLVHEVSGEILYGSQLVPHLAPGFPVYGLAAPPFSEKPLRTIQAMAMRMVRMIRAVQPEGPYRIAGWSFGATLAYEIAIQLIGHDASVEFIGGLDGYYLGPGAQDPMEIPQDDIGLLLHIHQGDAEQSLRLKALADEHSDFDSLVRAGREQSLITAELSADEMRQYLDRYRRHALAARNYIIHRIPVPLHLFAAEDTSDVGQVSPLRNWETVLPTAQIHLRSVPGNHHSMMESPHIASLGEALSQALRRARETVEAQPEIDYCPMVTIRDVSYRPAPVLCVPGAGGTAISFFDLADSLRGFGPIEALQPRGLDGALVPHASIPAAARTYLHCILQKYPSGPVHLLGHSFGGWVAFEMAQLLRSTGRIVASLTILDSEPPDSNGALGREYSRTEAIMELVDLYEQAAQRSLRIRAEQIDALEPLDQLKLLSERLAQAGLLPRRSRATDLIGVVRTFETALRTPYRPESNYPEPMKLVLAHNPKKDRQANEQNFEAMAAGWRRWAPALTVWQSPGNHMTLLRQPHVAALSDWLSGHLSTIKPKSA